MVWGVTVPWNLLLTTALGLWIMAAPDVLGSSGTGADSDHLVGALIVVVSVIAMAEVVRACRFLNLALALWLLIAAWVLDGNTTASLASDVAAGVLLLMVTWYRGPRTERFGAFEKYVV
jgi:hypothetical protein